MTIRERSYENTKTARCSIAKLQTVEADRIRMMMSRLYASSRSKVCFQALRCGADAAHDVTRSVRAGLLRRLRAALLLFQDAREPARDATRDTPRDKNRAAVTRFKENTIADSNSAKTAPTAPSYDVAGWSNLTKKLRHAIACHFPLHQYTAVKTSISKCHSHTGKKMKCLWLYTCHA